MKNRKILSPIFRQILLTIVLFVCLMILHLPTAGAAQVSTGGGQGTTSTSTSGSNSNCQTSAKPNGSSQATPSELQQCLKNNSITKRLNEVVNFLSAGVGIVVVGVIILGGIQYMLAGANATALAAARQRIINGLIALAFFMFIYAFLQWIIPGGVFS